MLNHDYHFTSHWRVQGTLREAYDIIKKGADYSRWWPADYIQSIEVEPGDANGQGEIVNLHSKAVLPYTLHWTAHVIDMDVYNIWLESSGDFSGTGHWAFEQVGDWVNIDFDWKIRAEKPLIRIMSDYFKPLVAPAFAYNHRWAMARGEESLRLEIARRRAATPEELAAIPAPPAPESYREFGVVAVVVGIGFLVGLSLSRRKSS